MRFMGIIMIFLGLLVMTISLVGCCGACCESKPLTNLYVILLILLIAAQGFLIAYALIQLRKVDDVSGHVWYSLLNEDGRGDFQERHDCCGYDPVLDVHCPASKKSCATAFQDTLISVYLVIGLSLTCLGAFQVINLVTAGLLASRFEQPTRRKEEELLEASRQSYRDRL